MHTSIGRLFALRIQVPASKVLRYILRHKVVFLATIITATGIILNPIGATLVALEKVAPYVILGMAISEAAWLAGAGIMLVALGKQLSHNPLKWRSSFKGMPAAAADSDMFKTGLLINTLGALAEFVIPTVAVTTSLPWQYWAILSFSTLDLWATIILRRAIWRGMRANKRKLVA